MSIKYFNIGILAIQGAFIEHEVLFKKLNENKIGISISCVQIRKPNQLTPEIDGIIIPGGESTTFARFLEHDRFYEIYTKWIEEKINSNKKYAIWGVCAGLILLSEKIEGQKESGQWKLGGLDIACERNGNGRQRESSEKPLKLEATSVINDPNCPVSKGIFIRSPRIIDILSPDVEILAYDMNDEVVAVKQNHIMVTSFHPELSDDTRWHNYFIHLLLQA